MNLEGNRVDVEAFDAAWRARWGDLRPIGYELRGQVPDRWVRFHSSPESKGWAETDAERAEMQRRHLAVLADLCEESGTPADALVMLTESWSWSQKREKREKLAKRLRRVLPESAHWRTLRSDPDDGGVWKHSYATSTTLDSRELRALLRMVARDRAQVIICPESAAWLYHPYYAGGDVIALDVAIRDRLRDKRADWLSSLPSGL
ncbi:MAG: hypothetical protein QM658_12260 [Gordonia sp. (in: high G+C Gram-positive bacteria)]